MSLQETTRFLCGCEVTGSRQTRLTGVFSAMAGLPQVISRVAEVADSNSDGRRTNNRAVKIEKGGGEKLSYWRELKGDKILEFTENP